MEAALIKKTFFIALLLSFVCFSFARADQNVEFGMSIGSQGLKGFYLAVGDYFSVPQQQIIVVKENNIPDEEMPVVFFIAQQANVPVMTVVNLRLSGESWTSITLSLGLSPAIFYVPVTMTVVPGPPYGHAYGYYRHKPRKMWNKIVLDDDDVVNLVNLKFVSEHYGYPPEQVIRMRAKGKKFAAINGEMEQKVKMNKGNKGDETNMMMFKMNKGNKWGNNNKGKGHGKGKGKGKEE